MSRRALYAFVSWSYDSRDCTYLNEATTKTLALRDRRALVKMGCTCGPIVRIPIPKRPKP